MTFTLTINKDLWRSNIDLVHISIENANAALVPVIKGCGYGLGNSVVCSEAIRISAPVVATGTIFEATEILQNVPCDVVVLEPFTTADPGAVTEWRHVEEVFGTERLVRTVSNRDQVLNLVEDGTSCRIILEGRTSVHRFGMSQGEIADVLRDGSLKSAIQSRKLTLEGLSLHLPITQPRGHEMTAAHVRGEPNNDSSAKVNEVRTWIRCWNRVISDEFGSVSAASTVWISHVDDDELRLISQDIPDGRIQVRSGSRLWLGERSALRAHGTVLSTHELSGRTSVGYRQRVSSKNATLVVVSGGSHHGVGLTGPSPVTSTRQRAVSAVTGSLDALG